VISEVLRTGEKSILALDRHQERTVVIKVLRTNEEFWHTTFAHEIQLYQALTENPPPVRVPTLLHTDRHAVLITQHIPGCVVDTERSPEHPLPATLLNAVLKAATGFAQWSPPPGVLEPVFDYPDRVERYYRARFFDTHDRTALHTLLAETAPPGQVAHGDPLPANLLLTGSPGDSEECVVLDFEFTGLVLPGFRVRRLEFFELPKTISGKIRRVELRQREHSVADGRPPSE
jgi:hypothetical protein